ncbi:MAG TPA: PadR family transcriptional regulator [Bryobacteraceae bacterium]|nr:PadR family transcriptional regulator [Bryobacteraceae bacterium]
MDLLVLKTLSIEPMHGWGIAERVEQVSHEALQIQQGSLYQALHRIEQQGWIESEWRETENRRRAKYYAMTPAGKRQYARALANWQRLSQAIGLVLEMA